MTKVKIQTINLINESFFARVCLRLICALAILSAGFFALENVSAQNVFPMPPPVRNIPNTPYRIGERLTYNFSFEKFNNAAYAEIYVASRGKLAEKDAVELRSTIKTTDFVSAAFYMLDESRTTYVSSETGFPLYIRKTQNASVLPRETASNFLLAPTSNYDLLTLIYQIRNTGGIGNFSLQEDERVYNVSLAATGTERVKTDSGDYDTNIVTIQSPYFVEKGVTDLRINFSTDEARIPILIRLKTAKGEFRGVLASIQYIEPEINAETTPTPIPTPRPQATPKPSPTATPYIDNIPLSPELPFALGETLDYQVSTVGGQQLGVVTLQAKERKEILNEDSLHLTATVTKAQPGQQVLFLNDTIIAQVNPETLAPKQIGLRFSGANGIYNQTTQFDQKTGAAIVNGTNRVDVPVGTHTILSLAYAIRSFNLKRSKDLTNPVNDTRVAVFLGSEAIIFILRPSDVEIINHKGEKVAAQMISISTGNGNSQVDQLNLRLWLSTDDKRLPLRFAIGNYQADLVGERFTVPR